ncbi:hypothetical protein CC86DRAFT_375782 [Ophiobolus disseminans]|uniref:P-loop containing nucleoside triphosphate hydrolase protein n=1 Tax=Ophiobolus disseminans TaxID=1469910 RepID=A0A6A6ZE03_9PLEO|nr:hypothetical protein CC86DRAFT_375782 [Ophiobolus disseminans]
MAGRLIDQDERTRQKPMRILVLGMCRTGTTSISTALRKLGYTPHQMREVLVNPKELALWQEAINVTLLPPPDRPASQRSLKPYKKPEFDKLLANYDVVMDLPGCVFAKELVEAYPDAKVILTTRDYAEWEHSMQESIWCFCTWRLFALARYFDLTQMAPLMRLMHSVFRVHNGNTYGGPKSEAAFEKHYNTVRSIVPKDRLLEVNPDETSWEPLCDFLQRKVPNEPFPRVKEDRTMRAGLENAWWDVLQYGVFVMAVLVGVLCLAIVFWVYADAFWEMRDEYILGPINGYLDR